MTDTPTIESQARARMELARLCPAVSWSDEARAWEYFLAMERNAAAKASQP